MRNSPFSRLLFVLAFMVLGYVGACLFEAFLR